MVRGNWQKRVERVEARRKESKEDRQKAKDKRQHKQWMQELVRFLDKLQQNQTLLERFIEKRCLDCTTIGKISKLSSSLSVAGTSSFSTISFHVWTDTLSHNVLNERATAAITLVDENDNDLEDDNSYGEAEVEDEEDEIIDPRSRPDFTSLSATPKTEMPSCRRKNRATSFDCSNQIYLSDPPLESSLTPSHRYKKNGRERSHSVCDESNNLSSPGTKARNLDPSVVVEGRRNRSNSTPDSCRQSTSKKKIHPRSHTKESTTTSSDDITRNESSAKILMSRSYFFTNKLHDSLGGGRTVTGSRSSGGGGSTSSTVNCNKMTITYTGDGRIMVYGSYQKTLWTVLMDRVGASSKNVNKESVLQDSEKAVKASTSEDLLFTDPGAMEVLFHSDFSLTHTKAKKSKANATGSVYNNSDDNTNEEPGSNNNHHNDDTSTNLFSEQITEHFVQQELKYANVVYAVFGDILIFDRYRDGLLYETDFDFWSNALDMNTSSIGGSYHNKNGIPLKSSTHFKKKEWGHFGSDSLALDGDNDYENSHDNHLSKTSSSLRQSSHLIRDLPSTVLEQILTFLPDTAVPCCTSVCKSWRYEIGTNSPHLWQFLLQRRNWPLPAVAQQNGTYTIAEIGSRNDKNHRFATMSSSSLPQDTYCFRNEFIRHYTAIRDVTAIKSAVRVLASRKHNHAREREMSYQDFSSRKFSPSFPNHCVGLQVWSPNRILAVYKDDCSLRLYETVPKSTSISSSNEVQCRELICQKVDPYRNTKRRHCRVVSMGLDEEYIGCLCHVMADNVDAEAYILVLMRREDFLLGESSGTKDTNANHAEESTLEVIDVGEASIHYLLSSEVGDHRILEIMDFLSTGGEVGEIEVLASHSIGACGYGRFMVEVSISLPNDNDDDNTTATRVVDRRLMLFSSRAGAIVWMGEYFSLTRELSQPQDDVIISYRRRLPVVGGSRPQCSIAVSSETSCPEIMITEISPGGEVFESTILEASRIVRDEIEVDGWTVSTSNRRCLLMSANDVIAGDTLVQNIQNNSSLSVKRGVLSFYPRHSTDSSLYTIIPIPYGTEIIQLTCLRDDHLVVLCRMYTTPFIANIRLNGLGETNGNNNDDDDEIENDFGGIQGNWFMVDENIPPAQQLARLATGGNSDVRLSIEAFVYHIPSRCEVDRVCILEDVCSTELTEVPVLAVECSETVGVGFSWKGVIMTGSDVRSVITTRNIHSQDDCISSHRLSKKKKKGTKPKQNHSKKDMFARGMSLRG